MENEETPITQAKRDLAMCSFAIAVQQMRYHQKKAREIRDTRYTEARDRLEIQVDDSLLFFSKNNRFPYNEEIKTE